jgi:hypothetical protein
LKAFVNIVDGTTGLVKATVQINSLTTSTKTLAIKTSGLARSVVFGRTVSSALPTTISLDDYVCLAYGTCIPTLVRDYDDYLLASATLEIKRRMGEDTQAEYGHFRELEADIEKMWSGRPQSARVARRNGHWGHGNSYSAYFRS